MMLSLMVSCVSIKPAKNYNKAEDKIEKFNKGIQNQIDKYPELISKSYTVTIYDTLFIESDSVKIEVLLNNISFLDSLNKEYVTNNIKSNELIDSLINTQIKTDNPELDSITKVYNNTIRTLGKELQRLQTENLNLFELYRSETNQNIEGFYEDSIFRVNYTFKNGIIYLDVNTKDKYEVVEKQINTFDIEIDKHFWQDKKFWILLLLLFNAIYFFGSELQMIIKKIILAIIKFIRKLTSGI